MDSTQITPDSPETIKEVKATQLASLPVQTIVAAEDEAQLQEQLHNTNWQEKIVWIEKNLLKLISFALIAHGIVGFYQEIIEVLYVFPHLPEIFADTGFDKEVYQAVYQKAILVITTAVIETIYGLALLAKHAHLVHRLHIVSGIVILVISLVVNQQTSKLEELDVRHRIPEAPTIGNLIKVRSVEEVVELFEGK